MPLGLKKVTPGHKKRPRVAQKDAPGWQVWFPVYRTEIGIRDFFCGIRDIMLDIEKYEFLVLLGIKYLIIGILSLIKYAWNNIPNTVFDNRDNIPNTETVLGIFF